MEHPTSNANKTNNIVKSRLQLELLRLDREGKNDIKNYNTDNRFLRAQRISRMGQPNLEDNDGGTDVHMYKTHIPGFCYHRNGEYRKVQCSTRNQGIDIEMFKDILFTDNETDVQKLLCLHLLIGHKCDSVLNDMKMNDKRFGTKRKSVIKPIEVIIEQTNRISQEDFKDLKLVAQCPLYIIDYENGQTKSECSINEKVDPTNKTDGKECDPKINKKYHIIYNESLMQLVNAVLESLQVVNPTKLQLFQRTVQNQAKLQQMIQYPNSQTFFNTLYGHVLITSIEAYKLLSLREKPPVLSIEQTNHFQRLLEQVQGVFIEIPFTDSKVQQNCSSESIVSIVVSDVDANNENKVKSDEPMKNITLTRDRIKRSDSNYLSSTYIKNNLNGQSVTSIVNAKICGSDTEYDSESGRMKIKPLCQIEIEKDLPEKNVSESKEDLVKHTPFTLRMSNCAACLQRFSQPHPTPKFPARPNALLDNFSIFTSNVYNKNTDELNRIITRKLTSSVSLPQKSSISMKRAGGKNSYAFSMNNASSVPHSNASTSKPGSSMTIDFFGDKVNFNNFDLVKIQLEVSEKETTKRVEKFFEDSTKYN